MMPDLLPHTLTPEHALYGNADKLTRDLMWSVCGPSLLSARWGAELPVHLPQVTSACIHKAASAADEVSSMRLGFRFEQLWHKTLSACGLEYEANHQVNDGNTAGNPTVGELDLLLPRSDHTLHLELALKFYLGTPQGWVGPNRRDLLELKLAHTQTQQLALPQRAAELGITLPYDAAPVHSLALMRGCLFHPVHDQATLPDGVNPDHWQGKWCAIGRLEEFLPSEREAHWYVLSRPEWISPVMTDFAIERSDLLTYLQLHFEHLSSAICIARMAERTAPESSSQVWCETERWMIVSDRWASAES